MRSFYEAGLIGHQTDVRWLPVAYAKPRLEEQDADETSPLHELCGDGMPPFMDAPMDPPAAARAKRRRPRRERRVERGAPPERRSPAASAHAPPAAAVDALSAREAEFRAWEAAQAAEAEAALAAQAAAEVRREMEAERRTAQATSAQAAACTLEAGSRATAATTALTAPAPAPKGGGAVDLEDAGFVEQACDASGGGDDADTSEWWFYVAGGAMKGPFTPYQMRGFYDVGAVTERTLVRWLPVCYAKPPLEAQDADETSPLEMLCGDGTPPFYAAVKGPYDTVSPPKAPPPAKVPGLVKPAAATGGASAATHVRSRVERARRSIETIRGGPLAAPPAAPAPLATTVPRPNQPMHADSGDSMRI